MKKKMLETLSEIEKMICLENNSRKGKEQTCEQASQEGNKNRGIILISI